MDQFKKWQHRLNHSWGSTEQFDTTHGGSWGGCMGTSVGPWTFRFWSLQLNWKKKIILFRQLCTFVCWSLTSLCHSNGHIETMPAREINPFTALTRIRSQFLRTQWSTSNHSEWTRLRLRPLSHRGWLNFARELVPIMNKLHFLVAIHMFSSNIRTDINLTCLPLLV